jgi:toxin YoeB
MGYIVDISPKAEEHILSYKKAGNKIALARIERIVEELKVHPETGIGKPEKKKHNYSGYWSREIDKKNRMIYEINKNVITVFVISAKGHYDDK